MAERPNPDGWVGGSEDFGFVRTFDGHRSLIPGVDEQEKLVEADFRRNERRGDNADLGGEHYAR